MQWRCGNCGFTYVEEEGLPEDNIAPGTHFHDIDEYWICPWCGSSKDDFTEVDDE